VNRDRPDHMTITDSEGDSLTVDAFTTVHGKRIISAETVNEPFLFSADIDRLVAWLTEAAAWVREGQK
jgi:hypothetical protein